MKLTIVAGGIDNASPAEQIVAVFAFGTACSRPITAQAILLTPGRHRDAEEERQKGKKRAFISPIQSSSSTAKEESEKLEQRVTMLTRIIKMAKTVRTRGHHVGIFLITPGAVLTNRKRE